MSLSPYRPPLIVDVVWSPEVATRAIPAAEAVYCTLRAAPDGSQTHIPVFLGADVARVRARTQETPRHLVVTLGDPWFDDAEGPERLSIPTERLSEPESVAEVVAAKACQMLGAGAPVPVVVLAGGGLDNQLVEAIVARPYLGDVLEVIQGEAPPGTSALSIVEIDDRASHNGALRAAVLSAKRSALPLLLLEGCAEGEARSWFFSGNTPRWPRANVSPDRLARWCLLSLLNHYHFPLLGEAAHAMARLPYPLRLLSRPPEPLDWATGLLQHDRAIVVMHPDPPLPLLEAEFIRGPHRRCRIATPSSLPRQARRDDAPLVGLNLALSLSQADDIPEIGEHSPLGLVRWHLDELISQITLDLVRSGATLSYGGKLDQGYTATLDALIKQHNRLSGGREGRVQRFLPAHAEPVFSSPSIRRLETLRAQGELPSSWGARSLSVMRSAMAAECDARICIGGKSHPLETRPEIVMPLSSRQRDRRGHRSC